jgi:uncharacterized SAM-binding protein YcdF (DUF218 family)
VASKRADNPQKPLKSEIPDHPRGLVVVVLGGRVGPDAELWPAAERRVQRAVRAFHDGIAGHLILSGGRRWGSISEAEAMRRRALELGVPAERTDLELCSLSTLENVRFSSELLRERGIDRLGLVTCDFHLARARRHFERAGFAVTALPAVRADRTPSTFVRERLHELASSVFDRLRDGRRERSAP